MRIVPQTFRLSEFAAFASPTLTLSSPVRAAAAADYGTASAWVRRGTYTVMSLAVVLLGVGYLAGMYNW